MSAPQPAAAGATTGAAASAPVSIASLEAEISARRDRLAQTIDELTERGLLEGGVEVTGAELARFVRLRDAVRAVLAARIDGGRPDGSAVRILESAALAAPGTPIGVWADDGTVTRGWRSTGGDRLDRAAATIAADVVDLVCDAGDRLARGPSGDARFVLG